MKRSDEAINYKLYIGANIATSMEIPARAIQTIIYSCYFKQKKIIKKHYKNDKKIKPHNNLSTPAFVM